MAQPTNFLASRTDSHPTHCALTLQLAETREQLTRANAAREQAVQAEGEAREAAAQQSAALQSQIAELRADHHAVAKQLAACKKENTALKYAARAFYPLHHVILLHSSMFYPRSDLSARTNRINFLRSLSISSSCLDISCTRFCASNLLTCVSSSPPARVKVQTADEQRRRDGVVDSLGRLMQQKDTLEAERAETVASYSIKLAQKTEEHASEAAAFEQRIVQNDFLIADLKRTVAQLQSSEAHLRAANAELKRADRAPEFELRSCVTTHRFLLLPSLSIDFQHLFFLRLRVV